MAWSSVGLVGAGPWVEMAVVPAVMSAPGVRLERVWARRPEAAAAVAETTGASVSASATEAMAGVDVVALCVPPDVQAGLLPAALASGAALVLEKPVARTVEQAEVLLGAGAPVRVHYARVVDEHVRPWLDLAATREWARAEVVLTNGATLGDDPFGRSPWRREPLGALWDLGPHALAWLHVVLGPATSVTAHRRDHETVLETVHPGGASATTVLSVASPDPQERFVLHAPDGAVDHVPTPRQTGAETYAALLRSHDLDVSSPSWRAVGDPRFSTGVVAALADAAAQLEG